MLKQTLGNEHDAAEVFVGAFHPVDGKAGLEAAEGGEDHGETGGDESVTSYDGHVPLSFFHGDVVPCQTEAAGVFFPLPGTEADFQRMILREAEEFKDLLGKDFEEGTSIEHTFGIGGS